MQTVVTSFIYFKIFQHYEVLRVVDGYVTRRALSKRNNSVASECCLCLYSLLFVICVTVQELNISTCLITFSIYPGLTISHKCGLTLPKPNKIDDHGFNLRPVGIF